MTQIRRVRAIVNKHTTQLDWNAKNPILMDGEMGVESDTRKFKIGNGYDTWKQLEYFVPGDPQVLINQHINAEEPHPAYDDGPDLSLIYQNARV